MEEMIRNCSRKKQNAVMQSLCALLKDESAVGTIEIVLILVVLIGLVIIFKRQITALLNSIFDQINSAAQEVY